MSRIQGIFRSVYFLGDTYNSLCILLYINNYRKDYFMG